MLFFPIIFLTYLRPKFEMDGRQICRDGTLMTGWSTLTMHKMKAPGLDPKFELGDARDMSLYKASLYALLDQRSSLKKTQRICPPMSSCTIVPNPLVRWNSRTTKNGPASRSARLLACEGEGTSLCHPPWSYRCVRVYTRFIFNRFLYREHPLGRVSQESAVVQ